MNCGYRKRQFSMLSAQGHQTEIRGQVIAKDSLPMKKLSSENEQSDPLPSQPDSEAAEKNNGSPTPVTQ